MKGLHISEQTRSVGEDRVTLCTCSIPVGVSRVWMSKAFTSVSRRAALERTELHCNTPVSAHYVWMSNGLSYSVHTRSVGDERIKL